MLEISDEALSVTINVERGGEIVGLRRQGEEVNALAYENWSSPLPAGGMTNYYDPTLDWLSGYRGGWQETLPNAGVASELDGMPLPMHGEGSVIPWRILDVDGSYCVLETNLRPTLRATRRMTLNGGVLQLESAVTNTGILPVPMVWGHHPAFAANSETLLHLPETSYVVEESMSDRIDSQKGTWPAATADGLEVNLSQFGSDAGQRLVYCSGHAEGWAVIQQGAGLPHVAMSWDANAYPAIWVWQNRGEPGFPWFGRLQCLGVEPQRAWPFDGLAGARSRGQELVVQPGATEKAWLTLALPLTVPARVRGVSRAGQVSGDEAGGSTEPP
ncbi:hypothetical protein [Paenarthrobacter sp. NPDC057981]|uniref:hypothetical protein n=1 Tax=Paenarthrobacter sp. NPDC057981 TaxID=3346297 RepID=UPI0036DB6FCF